VQAVLDEIAACTEEMNEVMRSYVEMLYRLKIKLAGVCEHGRTVTEWAWTRCLNCGATDITVLFASQIQLAASQEM